MIMSSKFDSYCRKCGRPIFTNDFIDYNKEDKMVICVCCYSNIEKPKKCPHWAINIYGSFTINSNKYKKYNENDCIKTCLICNEKLKQNNIENTHYIQSYYNYFYGKSDRLNKEFNSKIELGNFNQVNNPDKLSKEVLENLLINNINENMISIIKKHIKRINETNEELKIFIPNLKEYINNNMDLFIWNNIDNDFNKVKSISTNYFKETIKNKSNVDNSNVDIFFLENSTSNLGHIMGLSYLTLLIKERVTNTNDILSEFMDKYLVNSFILSKSSAVIETQMLQVKKMLGISDEFYNVFIKYMIYELKNKVLGGVKNGKD